MARDPAGSPAIRAGLARRARLSSRTWRRRSGRASRASRRGAARRTSSASRRCRTNRAGAWAQDRARAGRGARAAASGMRNPRAGQSRRRGRAAPARRGAAGRRAVRAISRRCRRWSRNLRVLEHLHSTDTGIYHLAAAMGVPLTTYFGPTQPWKNGFPRATRPRRAYGSPRSAATTARKKAACARSAWRTPSPCTLGAQPIRASTARRRAACCAVHAADSAGRGAQSRPRRRSRQYRYTSGMGTVVALTGQVGGAKLVDGLYRLRGKDLAAIVNTGDDYDHLTLRFSPDIDTVLYVLAGMASPAAPWEPAGESHALFATLKQFGGPDGADARRQVASPRRCCAPPGSPRTGASPRSRSISASQLGIAARVLPMSDDPVRTYVLTEDGEVIVPGILHHPRLRTGGEGLPLRRRRGRDAHARSVRCARFGRPRGGGHLPVQPLPHHPPDPGSARHARTAAQARRAGDRGDADRRRQGAQGLGRQDHGANCATRPRRAASRSNT